MNINLHTWLAVVLGVSSLPSASIAIVAASVAKADDGDIMLSSSTHRHHLNLRSNNHHANVGTPTITADVLSKSSNLRRLQEPILELIDTNPTSPLGLCQADCDDDSECGSGLMCYKRDGSEDVPGCSGEENSDLNTEDVCVTPCTQDYCVLHDIGNGIKPGSGHYGKCEGDCDDDLDCAGDLKCFKRSIGEDVPGCIGNTEANAGLTRDYCYEYEVASNITPNPTNTNSPDTPSPTKLEQTSSPSKSPVTSSPITSDPTVSPSKSPQTPSPTNELNRKLAVVGFCSNNSARQCTTEGTEQCALCVGGKKDGILCSEVKKCKPGSCDNANAFCVFDNTKSPSDSPATSNPTASDPTVSPSQSPVTSSPTTSDATVSPSQSPVTSNPTTSDSTVSPSPTEMPTISTPATFVPGDLTVSCDGNNLIMSTGMGCRKIATSGSDMFADGYQADIDFHRRADGATVIPSTDPNNLGGWYYVSNSESGDAATNDFSGGVGAIEFNKDAEVIGYEMILTGTTDNCGGGVTWYDTWVSCEEDDIFGYCYETSPGPNGIKCNYDNRLECRTEIVNVGGNYESTAYYKQPSNQLPGLIVVERITNLDNCEGNCAKDGDCNGGLSCYLRNDVEPVPGCFGKGISGNNYCTTGNTPTLAPTSADDTFIPQFYTTEDASLGPLTRYTPPQSALDTGDTSQFLHTPGGKLAYLVLNDPPDENAPWEDQVKQPGTFGWTEDRTVGGENGNEWFRRAEGIHITSSGILYFVSKSLQRLLTLDLKNETWVYDTTLSGLFDDGPDQLAAVWETEGGHENKFLYFCEDGGSDTMGNDIHGRNLITGQYFTLVQGGHKGGIGNIAESTGLAFTRNNKRLYVSFQSECVYEFYRLDGKPFDGVVSDTKYHTESP